MVFKGMLGYLDYEYVMTQELFLMRNQTDKYIKELIGF